MVMKIIIVLTMITNTMTVIRITTRIMNIMNLKISNNANNYDNQ